MKSIYRYSLVTLVSIVLGSAAVAGAAATNHSQFAIGSHMTPGPMPLCPPNDANCKVIPPPPPYLR
jgi:hypothetical protein